MSLNPMIMMNTMDDYVDNAPYAEVGKAIEDAMHQAERAFHGQADFSNVVVKSVEEMGIAAGTYNTVTGELAVRKDLLCNREAIATILPHVLTHEERHRQCKEAGGTLSEGLTDLWASEHSGYQTVDGYASEVRHAVALQLVVGREDLNKLTLKKDAESKIALAYADEKSSLGMDFSLAFDEAVDHLNGARGF